MKFFDDFKKFAFKGNVIDMAVGVVIGGAFGNIVTSLVKDIITPFISLLTGNLKFSELKWILREAVTSVNAEGVEEILSPEIAVTYGSFLEFIINFFIVAISIFVVVKIISAGKERMEKKKREEEEALAKAAAEAAANEPKAPTTEELLAEIRDLLAKK